MYIAIYKFVVKPGREDDFIAAWRAMTELLKAEKGSLGSRLHLADNGDYIAYAQWPDQTTYDNGGNNLPEIASTFRSQMKEACNEISTLYKLEVTTDLLA